MTTSPEPWTLSSTNQILDATGRPVAVFNDGRDADRCLDLFKENEELRKEVEDQKIVIERLNSEIEDLNIDNARR